ncbi:unnamed protein product [Prorocentrum cordatum]|uniref:Uncharacterized protein n=1 Tax=Prorocentrum cordatum TaxID=2364126 RepID=A0ABN9UKP4_9DINO|nr:unnamed protein product [Polarella glacialis]
MWQPACTVDEARSSHFFANLAHNKAARRKEFRAARFVAKLKRRRERSFMSSWSSLGPRQKSECGTRKETPNHIVAAARTGGFLTAVSASGAIVDIDELVGVESLSQRYRFLAVLKSRHPDLKVIAHDDARHLRSMVEANRASSPIAEELAADVACIVDEYHASAHVGAWCKKHCLPSLPENQAPLRKFPTNICEVKNSDLSPLAHTIHHMGRWMCILAVAEMVDVSNRRVLALAEARRGVERRKVARAKKKAQEKLCAATPPPELTAAEIRALMDAAQQKVDENFNAAEHLPEAVYKLIHPIATTTCQGFYSTTMMLLGAAPALTNGARVKLWSQKACPLTAVVIQVAVPQKGKSRLHPVIEEMFDTCDDAVADLAQHMFNEAREGRQDAHASVGGELVVNTAALQSFTFPEFFFRCSAACKQVECKVGDEKTDPGIPARVWFGNGFNLDEAYEFFDGLGLLGNATKDKDKTPSLNASLLNSLLQSGKTRRATRTCTNFGMSRDKTVSISILGNAHPDKAIPMDRGCLGSHTAATKERFVFCLDRAVPRRAPLPEDCELEAGDDGRAWLPLTAQQAAVYGWDHFKDVDDRSQPAPCEGGLVIQGPPGGYVVSFPDGHQSRLRYLCRPDGGLVATEYRISSRWNLPGPADHIRAAARRIAELFKDKPHAVLEFESRAKKILLGNQVAQSNRADMCEDDVPTAALHSKAAEHVGIFAGLLAVLEHGGGAPLPEGHDVVLITEDHVDTAWRWVNTSLLIREAMARGAPR